MDLELRLGMMVVYMKDIINRVKNKDKELIIGLTNQFIKEIGMMEEFKEKACMFIMMGKLMKDFL